MGETGVLRASNLVDRFRSFNSIEGSDTRCETRSPAKAEESVVTVMERAMERRLLEVSLRDHIDIQIRQKSVVREIIEAIREINFVERERLISLETVGRRMSQSLGKKTTTRLASKEMVCVRRGDGSLLGKRHNDLK